MGELHDETYRYLLYDPVRHGDRYGCLRRGFYRNAYVLAQANCATRAYDFGFARLSLHAYTPAMRKRVAALLLTLLLVVLLGFLATRHGELDLFRDVVRLRAWVLGRGPWAPVTAIALQVVQVIIAPIPGQVVGLASGYVFGVAWGTFYSVVGTALGSLLSITLARIFGRPLVERMVPAALLARLDSAAQRRGLFFLALVFLLPFLPDDLACFVAGLTRIPVAALMLVVLLGRFPGLWVSCWLGANATSLGSTQWSVAVGVSALLAGVLLRHGERLSEAAMQFTERLTGLR
jgi:uncharacterized membrane protein YdjX (TVP38/TMEM64 family)